jgi:hypothetical protein
MMFLSYFVILVLVYYCKLYIAKVTIATLGFYFNIFSIVHGTHAFLESVLILSHA